LEESSRAMGQSVRVARSGALLLLTLARVSCASADGPSVASGTQTAASAATASVAEGYHVVELDMSTGAGKEQELLSVFEKLGAAKEKAAPLIEKLGTTQKLVVVAGSKDTCTESAALFEAIGLTTAVRPLAVEDIPSEYDDSDVTPAGSRTIEEVLSSGEGALVAFYAPWCAHCKAMVEPLKEAAATLKESGVRVLAVDTQTSPGIAQQLGVESLPTVLWLQLQGGNIALAAYSGARDTASFVRFAEAAARAVAEGGADAEEASVVASSEADGSGAAAVGSKIGKSKVGSSQVSGPAAESKAAESKIGDEGVSKAKTPAEAEATA